MIQEDTTDIWFFFTLRPFICDKKQVDFSGTSDSMTK